MIAEEKNELTLEVEELAKPGTTTTIGVVSSWEIALFMGRDAPFMPKAPPETVEKPTFILFRKKNDLTMWQENWNKHRWLHLDSIHEIWIWFVSAHQYTDKDLLPIQSSIHTISVHQPIQSYGSTIRSTKQVPKSAGT